MTGTVGGLLALPEWADVVVLAGAAGVGQAVRDVRPVMALGRESVGPGELVVLVTATPPGDWRLDALARRIADGGGAGVLLPAASAPARGTLLLGDRLVVPVLAAEGSTLDLLVAARLALAAPDLERARVLLAVQKAVGKRLRTPEDVVGVLRGVLRAPVALLDDRGEPLAGDPVAAVVRVDEPVPQRVALADGVVLAHPALLPRSARPSAWLVVELRGVAAGRAEVVPPALGSAAGAVGRWLSAHRLELERDARSRTALLGDLLRSDGEPTADLRRRAVDAGWPLGGWHVGIRVGTPSTVDTVARGPEVSAVLGAAGVEAVVVEHGDGWTAWTTFDQEPTAARVRALGGRLRTAQRDLRRTLHAYMGVGRPHPRPEGLARTVGEATDAARLAATRAEGGNFLHVDQLGMAQLLLEWTRTDTFEPAARALLAPLHGLPGDLVRTLAAYLDAESSIADTAATLGVHRNTVAARVTRVEHLLGVDLAHRDERLALHLACRAVLAD
ncbi:helix-turn-helix domain-containing protein [Actinosynnema sp. NPDC020468]|uniref:PucR family transcriptional regulator n=1 Tax=Actinosynnema sp. NPDC020468 TaxID=3154488 RepID=UPI0033F974E1